MNATRRATHSLVPRLFLTPTKNKSRGGYQALPLLFYFSSGRGKSVGMLLGGLHMVRTSMYFTGAFDVASELLWQNVSGSEAFIS